MNDLIKEYFYDGIRRIIPGSLLIVLYLAKFIDPNSGVFWEPSIVLWLCLLGLAWGVGVALENLFYAPLVIYREVRKRWPKWTRLPEWPEALLHDETKGVPDIKPPEVLRLYQKFSAEKVMYRSLAIIALVTAFWPPALPATLIQAKVEWSCWYGGIGFVLACLFYGCARINEPNAGQVPRHYKTSSAPGPTEKS